MLAGECWILRCDSNTVRTVTRGAELGWLGHFALRLGVGGQRLAREVGDDVSDILIRERRGSASASSNEPCHRRDILSARLQGIRDAGLRASARCSSDKRSCSHRCRGIPGRYRREPCRAAGCPWSAGSWAVTEVLATPKQTAAATSTPERIPEPKPLKRHLLLQTHSKTAPNVTVLVPLKATNRGHHRFTGAQ